jgi:LAO/AO transport system kinase
VLDAAGYDVVIVETVGTGQSEIEIVDLAHLRVVVCAPGLGDEVQAIKAGVLEIADLYVVNKADLPHAEVTVNQLKGMLMIAHRERPVLATSATSGKGIAELVEQFAAPATADAVARDPDRRVRRLLAQLAAEQVRRAVQDDDGDAMAALCRAVRRGEMSLEAAARVSLEAAAAATANPRRTVK